MFKMCKTFTKKDWLIILLCFLLIATQVYLDLKLPDYMSSITTLIQTEDSSIVDILLQGVYMLVCALGSLISAISVGFLTSRLSANFSLKLANLEWKK